MREAITRRADAIEEAYEYMLAYAAQGLDGESGGKSGELRGYLDRTDAALTGLAGAYAALVETEQLLPTDRYAAFIEVLEEDARKAQAAVRLVMAQPAISSQLIDNLNASIHVRTLLTDLFVLDEALKRRTVGSAPSPAP